MNWIIKDVMLISFIVSGQIGITFHSQWTLRIILLCTFRIILFLSSQFLQISAKFQKKITSSEASFKKVRDPQTGGEGTFVMFLAERRALVVMEADMVKVYEKKVFTGIFEQ